MLVKNKKFAILTIMVLIVSMCAVACGSKKDKETKKKDTETSVGLEIVDDEEGLSEDEGDVIDFSELEEEDSSSKKDSKKDDTSKEDESKDSDTKDSNDKNSKDEGSKDTNDKESNDEESNEKESNEKENVDEDTPGYGPFF